MMITIRVGDKVQLLVQPNVIGRVKEVREGEFEKVIVLERIKGFGEIEVSAKRVRRVRDESYTDRKS